MKTLTALLTLAAGTVVPLTFIGPADAVGETCNGQAATLVGRPGRMVRGTDGPDVIVSNGASWVLAGAGDDLICTTGTKAPGRDLSSLQVDGEAGNDVIDRRGDVDPAAVVLSTPGPGTDQVIGSASIDWVNAVDGERDVISTAGGDDQVSDSASDPIPEPDLVDLGPGDDEFDAGPAFSPALSVTGGDGDDRISFWLPGDGSWEVDAGRGELRRDGTAVIGPGGFVGFESYTADGIIPGVRTPAPWRFVGSDGPDRVSSSAGLLGADLGGGDDELDLRLYRGRRDVAFDGGAGRDKLVVHAWKAVPVKLDLRRGRLDIKRFARGPVMGFEDAEVSGSVLDVIGTGKDNVLALTSCRLGTVSGLGGDDIVSVARFDRPSCHHGVVRAAYGGAGADSLTGSENADLLAGGRGRDAGDGGAGRDTCVSVEARIDCERR